MNKNIEHYVFRKENFLDKKYCENCIDELNKCDWEKHKWHVARSDSYKVLSGDNEPDVLFSQDHNSSNVFSFFKKTIMEKLKRFLNPSPMSEQSEGKLIRYMITREVLKRE